MAVQCQSPPETHFLPGQQSLRLCRKYFHDIFIAFSQNVNGEWLTRFDACMGCLHGIKEAGINYCSSSPSSFTIPRTASMFSWISLLSYMRLSASASVSAVP